MLFYNDKGEKYIIKNNTTKRFVLFLIILSIICTISCVNAIDYDSNSSEIISDSTPGELPEIYVSPDASDEIGNGSSQNPFKTLECAIDNSKDDSTIYLNDGEYVGENNRNINIDKSITIIGKSKENTIINGEASGRLFNVTSTGRLTLINITFLNAHTTENGGTIYCDGGAINIKNCIVKNSRADENGGVIYNNLGAVNIEDSCFTNNSASDYGGVLYTLGITTVKNSNFTGNVLTSTSAGIGACIASGGKIDLDGCLFYDCHTPYSSAGILNLGNATVNNCRFERLTSNYTAAAISNHKYMLINNSYFGDNYAQYYAAAILQYAGEELSTASGGPYVITEVYNTIFEKNHVGFHGAVSNNFRNTCLHIENSAFIDNYKMQNGVYGYGDISLDDNATVQYCWWGKNEISPYYYSRYNSINQPEKINASRWLIMTFTADNDVIYKNEVNKLTVSLKQYFDNETKEIYDYDDEFDLPLEVTFYTDVGTLATKTLVNGIATIDFNPTLANVVYAKINNQILKIDNFQLRETKIVVNDFEKYYGSSSKLSIQLVKGNNVPVSNEKVTVSLGGSTYTVKTDENGIAKLTIKNKPKTYTAKIAFKGNDYYTESSKSIKVKIVKPTIKASKTTIRKKGTFTVTFKDANKKAIKNVKVTFKIKGKTYVRTTNSKGQAKLTMNFKAGKYTVKVGFKSTAKYGTTTLTKKIKVTK